MDLREVRSRGKINSGERHPWESAKLKIVCSLLNQFKKEFENKIILDIGCGDAFIVNNLATYFPKTLFYAIDTAFSSEFIEDYCNVNSNVKLFTNLDDVMSKMDDNAVAGILLLDVIEHIENDIEFLEGLSESSKVDKNVKCLITVPAFQALFTSHDTFLGHYRRYTNKSLLKAIDRGGFKSISNGYFFFSLLPIRFIEKIKETVIKPTVSSTTGVVEWQGGKVLTKILVSVLWLDFSISKSLNKIGINLIGLSNYTICKKSV